ncbi:hypothetical protein C5609_15660 [Pseudomonas putida]|uniref:hypothetical protein n=1 Tax=Pseudomonas putida TaxID=303 RepID=UPI0010704FD5|nr:hypothetical protein [Pseudomonas putida]TFF51024.1 hypothetical protein C5609_15660 [Pseudomonas putida]
MNDSISGTATPAPLLVRFVLNRPIPDAAAKRREQLARQRELKRQTQLKAEQLALEYSVILLQRSIQEALDPATDPRLRRDLRNDVMNRGIGKPPEVDEEAAQRRKGGGATDLIEFLQAVSSAGNKLAGIGHQPGTAVPGERDITPDIEHDPDAQWFEGFSQQPDTEEDNHE